MLNQFQSYPFEKLNALISGITPPKDTTPFILTIGEPQFDTPPNITTAWQDNAKLLNKYPKSSGEDYLKNALLGFIDKRYGIKLESSQIIPTFGTREVLFNFPQCYCFNLTNPTIAYPNPFYQIYEGAAIASRANIVLMNMEKSNNFMPSLDESDLKRVNLVILNTPNNPTGRALNLEELSAWVALALEHNFVILSDECYSEIYESSPPPSILEASIKIGNTSFKNILALNSISKRSSAPGLRSGYIAGDANILNAYMRYRTYLGAALPLPLQKAASVAWSDMENPESIRKIYAKNLALAREILELDSIAPYTFYVWLEVEDDISFCKFAYQHYGVLVLPGSFLGREDNGKNYGANYVRVALVYDNATTKAALNALKAALIAYKKQK